MKIKTLLYIGFAVMILITLTISTITMIQVQRITRDVDIVFEHPITVRRALHKTESGVINISRQFKDLLLTSNNTEIDETVIRIKQFRGEIHYNIDILSAKYLGPKNDIDSLRLEFEKYNYLLDESISLIKNGMTDSAKVRSLSKTGITGKQVEKVIQCIRKIDEFSFNKANELYSNAIQKKEDIILGSIIYILLSVFIGIIVVYFIFRGLKKPVENILIGIEQYKKGNKSARIKNIGRNEFGLLAKEFNILAEVIEKESIITEKYDQITSVMLHEVDSHRFGHALLSKIIELTDSQCGAIYLLNSQKNEFQLFHSIGFNQQLIPKGISSILYEGEIGLSQSSLKIQQIKDVTEGQRYIFSTVSGDILPKEILTIPIVFEHQVIALFSLSTLNTFDDLSIALLQRAIPIFNTRINSVLANMKNIELLEYLEEKNAELNMQSNELMTQATELQNQFTELESQKMQLEEANRMKTVFLSTMSHELRTPLNSVIGLSSVLSRRLEGKIPDDEYSYLDVIERNGKHLLHLINDILDLSRIEAGREDVDISEFDLNTIVGEIIDLIKPQAIEKGIELNKQGKQIIVKSDISKCKHILQNLVSNAVKFTLKGGVYVSIEMEDKYAKVVVKDTGIGIATENINKVFDEFKQLESGTSRRFEGSGLGLSISKKLIQLLGGKITVDSKLDDGSVFTIYFPLESFGTSFDTQITSEIGFKTPITNAMNSSIIPMDKSILIVEDNESSIIQLKDVLDGFGYMIQTAGNGVEAVSIISEGFKPDAIILDLMMPVMDGFELLKMLRDDDRTTQIPILVLTAKMITKEELAELKRNNIHQLVRKGDVNRRELLQMVHSMMIPKVASPQFVHQQSDRMLDKRFEDLSVLVVEDNIDNMLTIKALLDKCTLYEATTGIEAIAQTQVHQPDMILMDIALPEMDGVEAFVRIRNNEKFAHIPIIAVTASALASDKETLLKMGFDAYVSKPVNHNELVKTMISFLKK